MTGLAWFSFGFGAGFCTAMIYAIYQVRRIRKALDKKFPS